MSENANEHGADTARIYDQGYRPFEGTLASPRSRFAVITKNEFRQAWKSKWFKRLIIASFVPLVVASVVEVARTRIQSLGGAVGEGWVPVWIAQMLFSVLVVFFVGRRAVGEDLRTGAMTVYFSRPVSFFQYLAGKWLAIGLAVAFVTLVPGLLLALFKWLARGGSGTLTFLGWMGGVALLSLLLCLTLGAVMLAVSSLTMRGRAAGIAWLVMFPVLIGVAEGVAQAANVHALEAISYTQANIRLAEFLFEGKGTWLEALAFVGGQLVWILAGFSVVLIRLRSWRKA